MGIFDSIIDIGADFIGGFLGAEEGDDPDRSVQPSTTSIENTSQIMYDEMAFNTMKNMAKMFGEWGEGDRNFLEETYRPYQEDIIAANTEVINLISKNQSLNLEQNMKDLNSSAMLKSIFNSTIADQAGNISDTAARFKQELDNLPTDEQRIGQAVSAVEQQFGAAAGNIRKNLAAQGLNVSQATTRDLEIQKATAKAGAVGAAKEGARRERMDALAAGTGVFSNVQTSQSQQLNAQQQLTQSGVGLGKLQDVQAVDSNAASDAAGLTKAGGTQVIGSGTKSLDIVQAGVTNGNFPGIDGSGDPGSNNNLNPDVLNALSPEDQKAYSEEQNKFSGGTGSDFGESLKNNNRGLYDKIMSGGASLGDSILGGSTFSDMLSNNKTVNQDFVPNYAVAGTQAKPKVANSGGTGGLSSSDFGAGDRTAGGHSFAG